LPSITPSQVEGPFYPESDIEQHDNVLWCGSNKITVFGRVTNTQDTCLRGVQVQLWQADKNGRYNHSKDDHHESPLDTNFKYWGTNTTDDEGYFWFQTLKPKAYNDCGEWRTPHLHFKFLDASEKHLLTTQMYFPNEPLNQQDHHLQSLQSMQRKLLIGQFDHQQHPFDTSQPGQSSYCFNVVIEQHRIQHGNAH
jgi:protocatechuate 3,4-dioxygenase beta subunit